MKINQNSWHFKLHDKFSSKSHWRFYQGKPVSLCSYFWRTIGLILLSICMMGFFILIAAVLISGPFFWLFEGDDRKAVFLVLIVEMVLLCMAVGSAIIDSDWWQKKRPKVKRDPGLFRSWLRAKKSKVCPLLELERDEGGAK